MRIEKSLLSSRPFLFSVHVISATEERRNIPRLLPRDAATHGCRADGWMDEWMGGYAAW